MGGRGEGISFVLCDNKLRTPKFLYAVIRGIPIVKPCWVESCVAAGSQVRGVLWAVPLVNPALTYTPLAVPPRLWRLLLALLGYVL